MPRVACTVPPANPLQEFVRQSVRLRDRMQEVEAIVRGDFAIYQNLDSYSPDRGNFRIAHVPHGMDVDHGNITTVKRAVSMVLLYTEHSAFFSRYFDRILSGQVEDCDFDAYRDIVRSVRRTVG